MDSSGVYKGIIMINVIVKVTGSRAELAEVVEGSTVSNVLDSVDYDTEGFTFKINGDAATLETVVTDGQTITLAEKVKGGL